MLWLFKLVSPGSLLSYLLYILRGGINKEVGQEILDTIIQPSNQMENYSIVH